MIIFQNTSKKIISVNSVAVMPGDSTELQDNFADLPSIKALVQAGKAIVTRKEKKAKEEKPAEKPVEEPAEEEAAEPDETEKAAEEPAKTKRRGKKKAETTEEESKAVEEALAKEIFG